MFIIFLKDEGGEEEEEEEEEDENEEEQHVSKRPKSVFIHDEAG